MKNNQSPSLVWIWTARSSLLSWRMVVWFTRNRPITWLTNCQSDVYSTWSCDSKYGQDEDGLSVSSNQSESSQGPVRECCQSVQSVPPPWWFCERKQSASPAPGEIWVSLFMSCTLADANVSHVHSCLSVFGCCRVRLCLNEWVLNPE